MWEGRGKYGPNTVSTICLNGIELGILPISPPPPQEHSSRALSTEQPEKGAAGQS